MQENKKDDKGVSAVIAGVAGAVIGASAAIVASVALKDEKNREKVKEVIATVKEHVADYADEAQKEMNQQKTKAEKMLEIDKNAVEKEVKEVKKAAR